MQDFPHHYRITANAQADSHVTLKGDDLPELVTAPPAQFGGPGDQWSPEELLVGAVADCFILTFRAIARASKLDWTDLECTADGQLERVERVTRFTAFTVTARLSVPEGTDTDTARRLLEKAENVCLVTRSLNAPTHLDAEVITHS
jgi:peroxiredoxin-like protein